MYSFPKTEILDNWASGVCSITMIMVKFSSGEMVIEEISTFQHSFQVIVTDEPNETLTLSLPGKP